MRENEPTAEDSDCTATSAGATAGSAATAGAAGADGAPSCAVGAAGMEAVMSRCDASDGAVLLGRAKSGARAAGAELGAREPANAAART